MIIAVLSSKYFFPDIFELHFNEFNLFFENISDLLSYDYGDRNYSDKHTNI